jgi:hypothetical protein
MWGVEEPEPDPFEATAAPDELSAKLHGQPEPLFDQVLATLRTIRICRLRCAPGLCTYVEDALTHVEGGY